MLHAAAREHNVIEFGEAPPDRAKMPVMKSVRLKESLMGVHVWLQDEKIEGETEWHLRPQISDPTPQKTAPTSKPMFCPSLRSGPLKVNSLITGVNIRPVTI
jgi:hypothetical protein